MIPLSFLQIIKNLNDSNQGYRLILHSFHCNIKLKKKCYQKFIHKIYLDNHRNCKEHDFHYIFNTMNYQ